MSASHSSDANIAGTNQDPQYSEVLWIKDYWAQSLAVIGSIGAAAGGTWLGIDFASPEAKGHWFSSVPGVIFITSLILTFVGSIATARNADRISRIQLENRRLAAALEGAREDKRAAVEQAQQETYMMGRDYYALLDIQLAILANHTLGFGDTERVSVYRHDDGKFALLCRYSKNPIYQRRGRPFYPDNEGCIGKAWREGEDYIDDLPDPEHSSRDYEERLRRDWNIPAETTRNFKMKSRSYAALAIENHRDERVGVMVFESTRTDVLKSDQIKAVFLTTEAKRFAKFIESVKPFEASMAYAKGKGF